MYVSDNGTDSKYDKRDEQWLIKSIKSTIWAEVFRVNAVKREKIMKSNGE